MKTNRNCEPISQEVLTKLYIEQNLTMEQVANTLNCSLTKVRNYLTKYGIKKPLELIKEKAREKTLEWVKKQNLENYGNEDGPFAEGELENLFLEQNLTREEIANLKNTSVNHVQYLLQKQGIVKPIKKKIETCRRTLRARHGVDFPLQVPEIKEEFLKRINSKFGGNSSMKSKEVIEKRSRNNQAKYGASSPLGGDEELRKKLSSSLFLAKVPQVYKPEVQQIVVDKEKFISFVGSLPKVTLSELSDILGCSSVTAHNLLVKYGCENLVSNSKTTSLPEKTIKQFVESLGVECYKARNILHFEENGVKKVYEIDIYCPQLRIGIEFNGNYWHNSEHKSNTYHINKSIAANTQGIFLYHVYEFEWEADRESVLAQIKALVSPSEIKDGKYRIIEKQPFSCEVILEEEEEKRKIYSFDYFFRNRNILIIRNFRIFSPLREKEHLVSLEKFAFEKGCKKIVCIIDCDKIPESFFQGSSFTFSKLIGPEIYYIGSCGEWAKESDLVMAENFEDIPCKSAFSSDNIIIGNMQAIFVMQPIMGGS